MRIGKILVDSNPETHEASVVFAKVPSDISERARELHRRALVVDAHADTLTEMTDRGYDLDAILERARRYEERTHAR